MRSATATGSLSVPSAVGEVRRSGFWLTRSADGAMVKALSRVRSAEVRAKGRQRPRSTRGAEALPVEARISACGDMEQGVSVENRDLAEMYRLFLLEEGYAPSIDDDGDVRFKFEGGDYFVLIDREDEDYFRLVYPAF